MCEYLINNYRKEQPGWITSGYGAFGDPEVLQFHRSLPDYRPTNVCELKGLASKLGLRNIYIKDEGSRFGVKAFKPLGASYSIYRFLKMQWKQRFGSDLSCNDFLDPSTMERLGSYTFCAATDGNHGRAVAWTANKLKQKAVIYMPADTAPSRIQNIRSENAEVVLVSGTFDECVVRCDQDAGANGWQVIADTAYPGYMELPYYVMAGYTTIFYEMEGIVNFPDHCKADIVILQAGVGGLAAAGSWYYRTHYGGKLPQIICLEPTRADSFLESAKHGEIRDSRRKYDSIMAGLNCGVSHVAFPLVLDAVDVFMTVSDDYAVKAMRQYYHPEAGDPRIISGESGASGLAGLLALLTDGKMQGAREHLKIGNDKSVLLINTEADTDPENFKRIIADIV